MCTMIVQQIEIDGSGKGRDGWFNLDQANVYNAINYRTSALNLDNRPMAEQVIPTYRCPTYNGPTFSEEPLYTAISPKFALRNYVTVSATKYGRQRASRSRMRGSQTGS